MTLSTQPMLPVGHSDIRVRLLDWDLNELWDSWVDRIGTFEDYLTEHQLGSCRCQIDTGRGLLWFGWVECTGRRVEFHHYSENILNILAWTNPFYQAPMPNPWRFTANAMNDLAESVAASWVTVRSALDSIDEVVKKNRRHTPPMWALDPARTRRKRNR